MLSWNANGLRDKIIELEDLILERNLDVIFIQETFLKNDPIGIPNYRMFREDRLGHQGGGVAIMIKCNIQHEQIAINHDRTSGSEVVGIEIMTNRDPLRLISVYNPPNNELANDFLEMIITETNLPTIVAGDFNAKHIAWSNFSNRNGNKLRRHCDNSDYIVAAPNEPTFYGPYRPDILDIVLIKNLHWVIYVTTLRELSSDHNPITIEFGEDPPTQVNRTYRVTNWRIFSQILENEYCAPEIIPTPVELDAAVEQFENTIISVLNNNFIGVPSTNTSHNVLPREIKEKIREKNRARRRYQRTLARVDKILLNRLVMEVRFEISKFKNEKWSSALEEVDPQDPTSMWKVYKRIKNKKTNLPPIHGIGAEAIKKEIQKVDESLKKGNQEFLRQRDFTLSEEPTPGTSYDEFKIPNKRSKIVSKMDTSPPIVVLNKFQVLAEPEPMKIMEIALDQQKTVKPVEIPQPMPIKDQNISQTNKPLPILRPPPLVIREKKHWPRINETLKSHGIRSDKNFNTRDGVRMILPTMEMFNKSKDIIDQQKIQYHTFNTPTNREIRAIFKGVAEDIEPDVIAKELQDKGFDPE
ncbi:hypothetical protein JTB14_025210 [Gonioctena quinquepunctata]|nr:hypothetical protein JTB14_025210 [Gonioctena quinquepunctata]